MPPKGVDPSIVKESCETYPYWFLNVCEKKKVVLSLKERSLYKKGEMVEGVPCLFCFGTVLELKSLLFALY